MVIGTGETLTLRTLTRLLWTRGRACNTASLKTTVIITVNGWQPANTNQAGLDRRWSLTWVFLESAKSECSNVMGYTDTTTKVLTFGNPCFGGVLGDCNNC